MSESRLELNLVQLTDAEVSLVQEIASISHADGTIIVSNGSSWEGLATSGASDGNVLTVQADGSIDWEAVAGSGDVTGPGSSTDNAIARFDGTGGKTLQNSSVIIDDSDNITGVNQLDVDSANGVDVNPGSDTDADILTVGVTGTPKLQWDESNDAFRLTKGLDINDNEALTFGTGRDADLLWDGTDLILDYDSLGGGTTDLRIQENGVNVFVIETGGAITTGDWQATDIAIAHGGTGASDAATARSNLGAGTLDNIVEDTTPQLGGDLDLNGNNITDVHELRLDATPDTDHTANGPTTNTFAAGESISIGDLCFFESDGEWYQSDANDGVADAGGLLSIALEAKTDGQAMLVALPGSFVRDDTWAWTVGATLYMSETAGGITETAPTTTDNVVRVIGHAVSADVIYFNPESGHITHA